MNEEYVVGYEAGYQDGWNAAVDQSVRTKDLTDEEIADCGDFAGVITLIDLKFARAVIAKDRSKNGII